MAVVQFPDEIIRQFLARLDSSPQFPVYLGALAYCAKKALDPSPLHGWWKAHASEIESENVELDFIDFLNGIITSKKTWEATRTARLAEIEDAKKSLKEEREERLKDIFQHADNFMRSVNEQQARRERFMDEHPEYRCIASAEQHHALFKEVFDDRSDPLKLMARWASALLPCGLPAKERGQGYDPDFSNRSRFGYDEERPAAFLIGSDPHAHLLELADWVTQRVQNEQLGVVLRWSLHHQGFDSAPAYVMQAVAVCSHATFVHLMCYQEVEPEDADGLLALLSLPLAMSASASGPPHLLPDFSFIGSASYFDSSVQHLKDTLGRNDLVASWCQFFKRYRQLRLGSNGGRGFADCNELFPLALANYSWEQDCYWGGDSNCVEAGIDAMQPDESCLLSFFLFRFVEMDDIIQDDVRSSSEWVPEFSLVKVLWPLLKAFRERSMHELASAMLAYYLVLAAIGAKGNLDGLDGLDDALIESRRLPGAECVERALEVICALAQRRGHRITHMKFEQFLVPEDRKVRELILAGEGETVEFKSTLRVNLKTGEHDRKIEHAVLKTIAAFLNKRGGILLVGVDDAGNVLGTEDDRFPNADKLLLHFKNLVKATAPHALDQMRFKMVSLEQKEILYVDCSRGDRPIHLLNRDTKQHEFYVRRGPATDRLDLPDAVAYIQKEFSGSRLVPDD